MRRRRGSKDDEEEVVNGKGGDGKKMMAVRPKKSLKVLLGLIAAFAAVGGIAYYSVVYVAWKDRETIECRGNCEEGGEHPKVVMFHRVPRTASHLLVNLAKKASGKKGGYRIEAITHQPTTAKETMIMYRGAQRGELEKGYGRVSSKIMSTGPRGILHGYLHVIEADVEGIQRIGLVREPLRRMQSHFFTLMKGAFAKYNQQAYQTFGFPSLSSCALVPTCRLNMRLDELCSIETITFCGNSMECIMKRDDSGFLRPTNETIARAKQNLKEKFAVVGITEYFDSFVLMLSQLFPTYFEVRIQRAHDHLLTRNQFLPDIYAAWPYDEKVYDERGAYKSPSNYEIEERSDSQILNKICASDIELYDYARELFAQKVSETLRIELEM